MTIPVDDFRAHDRHRSNSPSLCRLSQHGPSEAVISFSSISKSFNTQDSKEYVAAVSNINLEAHEGEIITLVGPSGCGKSTLLNMAAGLMAPTEGLVRYRGKVVTGIHGNVGYMTQNDHLLPWRSVTKNIEIPLEMKGISKAARRNRSRELMSLVGLSGFEDRYPSQISGGMRKRVALARVLAYDPETLLMDEPFGALDAQLRVRLQGELVSLCRAFNKTVLFVTHDLDEAITIADRCVVFSSRPGTIISELSIKLPPGRVAAELRSDPTYIELSSELWRLLGSSSHEHVAG